MGKIWVRLGWAVGAAVGVCLVLVLAVLIFANTNPGRNAVAALLNPLLGGKVAVIGLSGRFPDAPTAAHVEIRDRRGVWLTLDYVSATWSPLQLLRNRIVAHSITAERAIILRWPLPGTSKGTTPPIDIKRLEIGRLTIGRAIAPRSAAIALFGSVHYLSSDEFSGTAHAKRLDAAGEYEARIGLKNHDAVGTTDMHEPAGGLVQDVLHVPGLGPVAFSAHADGPAENNRIDATLTAGALHAGARGTIDLERRAAAVSFDAASPGMSLRPDLSWQSLSLTGRLGGRFTAPDIAAHLGVQTLRADGASASSFVGDASGRNGEIRFKGTVSALRLPGAHPDLLASSPVTIEAQAHVEARRMDVSVAHRLLSATVHVSQSGPATEAILALDVPALAPFAAAEGVDAQGHATLSAILTDRAELSTAAFNGTLRLDAGNSVLVRALGRDTRFAGLATLKDGFLAIDQSRIESNGLSASANGTWRGGVWNFSWALALKDLSRLAHTLAGRVALEGTLTGRNGNLSTTANGTGAIATRGFASGPLRIALRAQGLPRAPAGTLAMTASLDKAPLALSAKLTRNAASEWHLVLDKADWKSVRARGDVVASASLGAMRGKLALQAGSLVDLEPIIGQPIKGKLDGTIALAPSGGHARAEVLLAGDRLGFENTSVAHLKVAGSVTDPLTKPVAALGYEANGLAADGVDGDAKGTITGPDNALALTLASNLQAQNGQKVAIVGAATADVPKRALTLTQYDVRAGGEFAHLVAPAHFDLAGGVAVDLLRIAAGQSEFDAAGRFSPRLDATLNLKHATGDLLKPFLPNMTAQGMLSATATLSGTPDAPTGAVALTGKGLRLGLAGAAAMPPADLSARATLHGTGMTLDASVRSGTQIQFTFVGESPLRTNAAFNLHAMGSENLAVLDPFFTAHGRSLHGNFALDAQVTGTFAKPRIFGHGKVSGAEFQDFIRGIRLYDMAANLDAHGAAIAIDNFTARAGEGTVSGSGNVDLTAPGEPVTLTVTARNARPVANDVVNATLDANLRLAGKLAQQFSLSGNVTVRRAEIDIPDNLPPRVVVLNIRGKGRAAPPPPIAMSLDLELSSPGQLYVRGHGLDAEMSGNVHIGGTTLAPDVSGGFDLRRGTLDIAGQTLAFSSGRVSFDSGSLTERIDPALDFTAQTTAGGTTATLNVGGHASAPKIALSSTPSLPQDEILSRLLFQQNMTQLSPFQMAELGQALASLGGMGGLGDPLTRVRRSLGLDRLAVTTAGSTGNQTAVEAGRYVARNVYVGAKQGVSGTGTQAVVQVDLTKHLKLQTQISSNNTPTPVTPGTVPVDTGSNLGLSYQFEY